MSQSTLEADELGQKLALQGHVSPLHVGLGDLAILVEHKLVDVRHERDRVIVPDHPLVVAQLRSKVGALRDRVLHPHEVACPVPFLLARFLS